MALKIRLRQQGRAKRAFYRLVVTDSRAPRDGKYLEAVGWYNPVEVEQEKQSFVKPERLKHWLSVGAQLTDNAAALVKRLEPAIMREQVEKELSFYDSLRTTRKKPKAGLRKSGRLMGKENSFPVTSAKKKSSSSFATRFWKTTRA